VNAHVEIRIRLKLKRGQTLHGVLRRFAQKTEGWKFPKKQSLNYQNGNDGQAGFVVCDSIEGLEKAAVAIANLDPKHPNSFRVPNIVPRSCSSLTLEEYNAIGLTFARHFGIWLRKNGTSGSVVIVGPNKTLEDIIPGEKSRRLFEAWLHTPTPLSHPSDLYALDRFICHLFRHPGKVRTYEIESYLIHDRGWKADAARVVMVRIETGLELLRVDREF
jgi:hypothetical protein